MKRDKLGEVYAIRNEDTGATKIGFSTDAAGRTKGLQTGHESALTLIGSAAGTLEDEGKLHELLAKWDEHVRGEWFRGDLTELVSKNLSEMDKARAACIATTIQISVHITDGGKINGFGLTEEEMAELEQIKRRMEEVTAPLKARRKEIMGRVMDGPIPTTAEFIKVL